MSTDPQPIESESITVNRTDPGNRGLAILLGLSNRAKHVYGGTVPAAEVARRRAKNKAARKSRRANRPTR